MSIVSCQLVQPLLAFSYSHQSLPSFLDLLYKICSQALDRLDLEKLAPQTEGQLGEVVQEE